MIDGSCLCGALRYQAEHADGPLVHCHCQMCRKVHGSAFASILPVEKRGFRWNSDQSALTHFESSPGKRRWFCKRCGSHLISTRDDNDSSLLLRAGCIDRGYVAAPVAHGWVEFMAPWHQISDRLPQFDRGFPGSPPGT